MKTGKLSVFALIAAAAVSCGPKTTEVAVQERVEKVETSVLEMKEITRVLEFSTTLQGYQTMNVAPSLTGKIEHIYVEVGTPVKQGTLLVRMDQNQLNTTKLTYANLGVEMQRLEALKETGAVSQQTYDQTAENLSFLETNTFFKAPFAGVISAKNYEDGELYSGQPILVLTQIQTLKALINIPESYFPYIKTGMKVDIKSDIYPDEIFPSTIEIVYPTVDESSHTFQAKLKIPNSALKLRPGMYVHTSLPMGLAKAMVVPYQSVMKLTGANDRYVFIDNEGVAKRVFVELGQRFDDQIEIISDELNEGDMLVTRGQSKLVDGAKVSTANDDEEN